MEWAAAITHLRQALGKGPDAALSAAARIMEYGADRTCAFSDLAVACAKARARDQAEAAWTEAHVQGG